MILGADRTIELLADLSEWWICLLDDGIVRTWGASVSIVDGFLVFGVGSEHDGFVELCAVPITSITWVARGDGVNGVPEFPTVPSPRSFEPIAWMDFPVGTDIRDRFELLGSDTGR